MVTPFWPQTIFQKKKGKRNWNEFLRADNNFEWNFIVSILIDTKDENCFLFFLEKNLQYLKFGKRNEIEVKTCCILIKQIIKKLIVICCRMNWRKKNYTETKENNIYERKMLQKKMCV